MLMNGEKPPFVLVHGAWVGGWYWRPIARILRGEGHEVFTPTNTGLGERRHLMSNEITMDTFVTDVLNVVLFEDLWDVILVGHSLGGRSITGVADKVPERIRQLIYLDAGLPLAPISRLDAMTPEAREERLKLADDFDGGLSIPPPPVSTFGVYDREHASYLEARMTPQPFNTEKTFSTLANPIGNGVAATYVQSIAPTFDLTSPSADYARSRPDWRFLEFPAGHNFVVTHPCEVAELLLAEARNR